MSDDLIPFTCPHGNQVGWAAAGRPGVLVTRHEGAPCFLCYSECERHALPADRKGYCSECDEGEAEHRRFVRSHSGHRAPQPLYGGRRPDPLA